MSRTVIIGSGSYIPALVVSNKDFSTHTFYGVDGMPLTNSSAQISQKFEEITGIASRRYALDHEDTVDLAYYAAIQAIEHADIDVESLDQIIFAHNYGVVAKGSAQSDTVPALAARLKHKLQIKNPACIGYDLLFGCPGWLQGVIHAHAFFKSGMSRRILVVGSETLSRVIDPHDRDSMIFSDGAGAAVLERYETGTSGILSFAQQSHCLDEVRYIDFGCSYNPMLDRNHKFIKMKGRKVYEYALKNVAVAMKSCLEDANVAIQDVKKILIHQANEKMDEAIIKALYQLYGINQIPTAIMPMSIHTLGNSSVATIPTLFDLILKGQMPEHVLKKDDIILFASVGAGMNINAVCYKM